MVERRAEAGDLRADHADTVMMKLFAQEQSHAVPLEKTGGDDLRVVGGRPDRLVEGRVGAAELYRDVDAPATGEAFDRLGGAQLPEIYNVRCAELLGQIQPSSDPVDSDYGSAVKSGELGGDQTRHALAEYR